jgi:hypothetical protein
MKPHILAVAAVAAFVAASAAAQVTITNAWVRGTVASQKATGAFMQLASGADTSLVGVSSPVAKISEIHTMVHEGGVMRMRAIASLPVPAGKPVELAPGGYHLMLLDLAQPLREGDKVPLTLTFSDKEGKKSTQEVTATVRSLTAPVAKPQH